MADKKEFRIVAKAFSKIGNWQLEIGNAVRRNHGGEKRIQGDRETARGPREE